MVKKVTLKILTDLHVLSLCEYRKVVFGMPSVGMYVHLTSAFNGSMDFIHIQYPGVSIIGQCLTNINILAPAIFSKMAPAILTEFQLLHRWHLQENNGMCTRGPNAKCKLC
jgi:ABC-type antimicrobial peptide transport system permease subunit